MRSNSTILIKASEDFSEPGMVKMFNSMSPDKINEVLDRIWALDDLLLYKKYERLANTCYSV